MRRQPVPWAYFHLLNLMSFLTLLLVSYMLVFLASWPVTLPVHMIICLIVLGLKNLAVAMSDPFGDDVIDFKVERFLAGMFDNSVAHLCETYKAHGTTLPEGIHNPLPADLTSPPMRMMSIVEAARRAAARRSSAGLPLSPEATSFLSPDTRTSGLPDSAPITPAGSVGSAAGKSIWGTVSARKVLKMQQEQQQEQEQEVAREQSKLSPSVPTTVPSEVAMQRNEAL